jgi:cytochrome c553
VFDYYKSEQWAAIRAAAIAAAGGKCEFCGAPAETAHHVSYPKRLGTEDPHTLIATCWRCHGLLHGRRPTPGPALLGHTAEIIFSLLHACAIDGYIDAPRYALTEKRMGILQAHLTDLLHWALSLTSEPSDDDLRTTTCGYYASACTDVAEAEGRLDDGPTA